MDLSRLQELKAKLIHDKDLLPVWGFFLDHFGEDLEFMELGEPVRHELIESVVAQTGLQMFPRDGMVSEVRLIRLADQQFIHGGVNVGGRAGGVFYFEDVQVGLVAVSDHFPSDETKMARFSCQPYRRPGTPSRN
jgi:hypothetical protein